MWSGSSRTELPEGEIFIRDYLEGDFPAIASLWQATGLGDTRRGDDAETIKKTLRLGGRLLVMFHSPKNILIGTSWMSFDGRRIHLHHFGIHTGYRGKGLASLLLEESLRFARESRTQIKLEVSRSNQSAVALYLKHGFRSLGDYEVYILRDP